MKVWFIAAETANTAKAVATMATLVVFGMGCGDYGRHDRDSSIVTRIDGGEVVVDSGPMVSHYDPVLGNAFDFPVELDDARVEAMDPSLLPEAVSPCRAPMLVRVTRVIDGDTVAVNGVSEHVRFIGVDTPEIAHSGPPPTAADCYGPEAQDFTAQLRSREIWLTFDAECHDVYDRLLAYLWVGPNPQDSWQRQLLRRGFARTLSIPPNTSFHEEFAMDQAQAVRAGEGKWTTCR